ncbi:unnamed protein product [Pleuronectes platessa]|uniref:Uncharacterized protein n=1 Tax=Pleuronectes platessa TaxID=8262 RepID=A0A9N7TK43_PLEPL|nr:unnamed protein product [Pleuronectes platessa]
MKWKLVLLCVVCRDDSEEQLFSPVSSRTSSGPENRLPLLDSRPCTATLSSRPSPAARLLIGIGGEERIAVRHGAVLWSPQKQAKGPACLTCPTCGGVSFCPGTIHDHCLSALLSIPSSSSAIPSSSSA